MTETKASPADAGERTLTGRVVSAKIADNAVQVLGGHGYIRDHLVELFLRDARAFATLDGLATV